MSHALRFLILLVAGWLQRPQAAKIEYLITENALFSASIGELDDIDDL
jgi:hypothetical protein